MTITIPLVALLDCVIAVNTAPIIINRIDDVPADKIVFLSEYELGVPKTLISKIDHHYEIKFVPLINKV